MKVAEAKQVAGNWVSERAAEWPDLRAAHLVGGITAMADDVEFPASKDVDMHLIFAEDSPRLGGPGPIPNLLEVSVEGIAIEAGLKPVSDYRSPELVLGNPELAFHFTVDSVLYDPSGWLSGLCREVIPQYAEREWVDRRMEHERQGFERALQMRALGAQMLGPSGELTLFGYSSTFLAGAFSVAALQPPRIGGRLFVTIREYLDEQQRLDLHERLLATFGLIELTRSDVQKMLDESAVLFELALVRRTSPHPFEHKLRAHLRPYFVDSSQRMIDEGFPREAAGWILPFYLGCTDVLKVDGTDVERAWAMELQASFLRQLGFDTVPLRDARYVEMANLAQEIFELCDRMIDSNSAIVRSEIAVS